MTSSCHCRSAWKNWRRGWPKTAGIHKPTSSDGYAKPGPKSLRGKSNRGNGDRHGHPGSTLTSVENPDFTVLHRLKRCS
ncbi:MAG: hypothetical protein AAB359_07950 [Elusimicrobiota bacterium]